MPAYFIAVRKSLKDPEAFKDYAPLAQASLAAAKGQIRAARGRHKTVEGDDVESVVVIELPDYETAVSWYESPAYQEALAHRLRGGEYQSFIVEGAVPVNAKS